MEKLNSILNERLPARVKILLRRLAFFGLARADNVFPRATAAPPAWMPFVVGGDFHAVGAEYFRYFVELGRLIPSASVLDVGCGLGRMAEPLTNYLVAPPGRYEGFDIEPEAIAWCTRRFPHLRFQLIEGANANYYRGPTPRAELRFPFPNADFDFVIVTSVFTQMLPAEVERYLSELARVMKPGARSLMTFFLLNPESKALIDAGQSALKFTHAYPDYRVINPRLPEAAVAHAEDRVRSWLAERALRLQEPIHYGNWCARPRFLDGQDIIIVSKS